MADKDPEEPNSCGFLVDGKGSVDPSEGENVEPWMQYPMEDSLDKNYYSDLLGDIPISSTVQNAGDSIPGAFSCEYPAAAGGLEADYSRLQSNGSGGRVEVQFSCDATATSSSGGSLSSPAKSGKEGRSGKKRVQTDVEDVECQSEEAHEESGDNSKQPSTAVTSSSKRSRAAQVHNLSEKRRRNRINEKMKALQNLIPNSNKTDKASMLDEAIDYLKQLQLQVQMLSARNGVEALPMHMLSGLTHLPMQQMPQTCMSPGDAGMDLRMGMGTGLMNIGQGTAGQTLLSLHNPYTGGLHPTAIPYPSITGVDVRGCMQMSCEMGTCSQAHLPSPQVPTTSQAIYTTFFSQQQ